MARTDLIEFINTKKNALKEELKNALSDLHEIQPESSAAHLTILELEEVIIRDKMDEGKIYEYLLDQVCNFSDNAIYSLTNDEHRSGVCEAVSLDIYIQALKEFAK